MPLRAKSPKKGEAKRLKFFLYGPAGCGKTIACLQLLPKAVIIDTENGAGEYKDLIREQGSVLLQTNDIQEIKDELLALYSEKHEYTSLIIDPVTVLYQTLQEHWDNVFESQARKRNKVEQIETRDWGFGFWGKVKSDFKRMTNLLTKLDMNIAMTAHQKDEYAAGDTPKKIGVTFDSMKGADYFFDTVFRMHMSGTTRKVVTQKERSFPNPHFPKEFEWDVALVRTAWGEEVLDRESLPVQLASPADVARFESLVEALKFSTETLAKWKAKAKAETWSDFSAEELSKCIGYLEKQLPAQAS